MVLLNENSVGKQYITRDGVIVKCAKFNKKCGEFYQFNFTDNFGGSFHVNNLGQYDVAGCSNFDIIAELPSSNLQEAKKYIIYVDGKDLPRVIHTDFETAKKEATRLAQKHTQNKVNICEIVETLKAKVSVEVLNDL